MKQPVCELCGGKEFTKQDGMFVCQSCGTKYTTEEAKALIKEVPDDVQEAGVSLAGGLGAAFGALGGLSGKVAEAAADQAFNPGKCLDTIKVPLGINNYICDGWRKVIADYEAIEHPGENDQQALVEQAKACLAAMDAAARLEPENHAQAALLYDNCKIIIEEVKDTYFFTENEDGSWKRNSLPFNTDFKLAGQVDSWDAKYRNHASVLEQEYVDANPAEAEQRAALEAQAAQLEAELGELKSEKKSHGFFDFSGKREVKERMAPVKEQLGQVRSQINALDRNATDYAERRIEELATTFTRL